MRLSDAIASHAPLELYRSETAWNVRPVSGSRVPLIERYGPILAMWWRSSPSCVLECATCGEIRLTGKRVKSKRCGSCPTGTFAPLDLSEAFTKKRPRAKKEKLS